MPGKKHLRGASAKEQRQYEHILESAQEEGRYGKRAKEVAARTVMKEHAEEGHRPHRASSSGGRKKSPTRRAASKKATTRQKTATRKGASRKAAARKTTQKSAASKSPPKTPARKKAGISSRSAATRTRPSWRKRSTTRKMS